MAFAIHRTAVFGLSWHLFTKGSISGKGNISFCAE